MGHEFIVRENISIGFTLLIQIHDASIHLLRDSNIINKISTFMIFFEIESDTTLSFIIHLFFRNKPILRTEYLDFIFLVHVLTYFNVSLVSFRIPYIDKPVT